MHLNYSLLYDVKIYIFLFYYIAHKFFKKLFKKYIILLKKRIIMSFNKSNIQKIIKKLTLKSTDRLILIIKSKKRNFQIIKF